VPSLWKNLTASLAVFGATLVVSIAKIAAGTPANTDNNTQIDHTEVISELPLAKANSAAKIPSVAELSSQANKAIDSNNGIAAMTSVSQLSDVQPTDWAFQALQSLVEHYGCIAGYSNSAYLGNRALTRIELAAGLNACLARINQLIASATTDKFGQADLVRLQRLQAEFAPQLAMLRGRADALEARTAQSEVSQFSTTTKLRASALFATVSVLTGQNANGRKIDRVPILGDRFQLNFATSFNGRDLLLTRLRSRTLFSLSGTSTSTADGDLRFAGPTFSTGGTGAVGVDTFAYIFPIGQKTVVYVDANSGEIDDTVGTLNPYIDGDGNYGALSNFGTRNPIYNLVSGAGLGVRHNLSNNLVLGLGYLASAANNPSPGSGLFNGPYGAIAQLVIKPSKNFDLGLTYVNSFNTDLTAGSNRANIRSALLSNNNGLFSAVGGGPSGSGTSTGVGSIPSGRAALPGILGALRGDSLPVTSNSYAVEASWRLTPKFLLNGWVGYTASRTLSTLKGAINRGDLSILNYALILAFPDLGKQGSVAGLVFGMEPRVIGVSHSLRSQIGTDRNNSLHIEGFYQYRLTDHIAITPGVIWTTNPNFNQRNADILVGVIRTRFTF